MHYSQCQLTTFSKSDNSFLEMRSKLAYKGKSIFSLNILWYSRKGAVDKLQGIVPSSLLLYNPRVESTITLPNSGISPVSKLSFKYNFSTI